MGVLNVTPDSFSDGGLFFEKSDAVARAVQMAKDGADIIDVGGESTRPGAGDVDAAEELRRVIPVIRAISDGIDIPVSIDTRKAKVAEEALKAGASIVNDVSGLRHDPAMAVVVAKSGAYVIVMHMKGTPQNMQANPVYYNLMKELAEYFKGSVEIASKAGVKKEKIIIDPGIGFGKTVEHNIEILNRLGELKKLDMPICVGTSRKSFIGKILNSSKAEDRLAGTIATCVIAVMNGANILRVHDVKEVKEAALITDSILNKKHN